MSEPAITVSPAMTVQEAADLMAEHDVGCLPVIQDGRTVGVVDARDLLQALSRGAP
jgi:acetoin utilization protein AcuB